MAAARQLELGFARRGCGFGLRGSRGAGDAFYRPEQGPLACAPRRGAARAPPGLGGESRLGTAGKTGPTGGTHPSVEERGVRERWTGPGKAAPGRCFGPARVGLQGKEKRGRYRLVGLKTS